jgi:hypothetical protein
MCRTETGNIEFQEMIYNFGKVAALVAGLVLAVTACAAPPPAPYFPISSASPVYTSDGVNRGTASYRPVAPAEPSVVPPVAQHTPEPAFEPQPVPAPYEQPVDPGCGWWRLCNLWSGS